MTPTVIEINGKNFVPVEQFPSPTWPSILAEEPQPTLTIKDDNTFLVTDTLGNISGCLADDIKASLGLFCRDTRFLSRLELQIEQRAPVLLNSTADKGFMLSVLCTNPRIGDRLKADTLGIQRDIVLNGGLFEEIEITNYSTHAVTFEMSLSFDADFVDLFEVRGYHRKQEHRGQRLRLIPSAAGAAETNEPLNPTLLNPSQPTEEINLAYQGLDKTLMETRIQFSQPVYIKGSTAVWQIELNPHQTQKVGYRLRTFTNNQPTSSVDLPANLVQAKVAELLEEQTWTQNVTQIRSSQGINQMIERAEQDIYLLRQSFGHGKALSAGVPWFAALFGRDSLIAASQTLILDPTLAKETLTILAHYQGTTTNEWREEEPGKILHELRFGELARRGEIPHTPYYGTVDATPLWLMLYAEYYFWTGDRETLERLWSNALAAMEWIDRSCQKTGYLSYLRHPKSPRGLVNQGWKDSEDCIVNRHGQLATGPITLCEVQAYIYAAKRRLSEIARLKQRPDLAERWQAEAQELKERFNQDFWLEDQEYCALALDGQGKPVDSISSNPGHCISLGILTTEKAYKVAQRLTKPDMFSGWGIRTLSSASPAYNPMGYHVGSVWPHDNALIAAGLRSLGLVDQALAVAQGLFEMTLRQPYSCPPELFCGYERQGDSPVRYPVACSPQAWATGSIFQLLRMMINLVPNAPDNCLRIIDPALPQSINYLSLKNLKVGSSVLHLEFERRGKATACRVIDKQGDLRVMIEA